MCDRNLPSIMKQPGLTLVTLVVWTSTLILGEDICIVPKCCPPKQSILESGKGCHNSSLNFNPEFWNGSEAVTASDSELLNIIVGDPCKYGKYRLEPNEDSSDEFHILCNGSLLVPFQSSQLYGVNHYCLEAFSEKGQEAVTLPLLCFPPPPLPRTIIQKVALVLYPVGLLISVPFLILTAVVFTFIPELRDTQGKSLACHTSSLAVGYITLTTVMLFGSSVQHSVCIVLAFVIQLSFVSCFFWLNVLCIDTWWRLTRKPCFSSHQEHVRFLWYSVYSWSLPLLITLATVVCELTPIVPYAYLKPDFGVQSCWFGSRSAALPYFYFPIGLLLVINICIFCASVSSVRSDLEQRAEEEQGLNPCRYSKAYQRIEMFKQCLILFLVMGLNWTLELLSYLIGGPVEIWVLTDTLNTLQGVIIYLVFIVRVKHVRELASKRLVPDCLSLCD